MPIHKDNYLSKHSHSPLTQLGCWRSWGQSLSHTGGPGQAAALLSVSPLEVLVQAGAGIGGQPTAALCCSCLQDISGVHPEMILYYIHTVKQGRIQFCLIPLKLNVFNKDGEGS